MTRFEQGTYWVDAKGHKRDIEDLETRHLINILIMIKKNPMLILDMLIKDIEDRNVWSASREEDKKESLQNVTSMHISELETYFYDSKLYDAIYKELMDRGIVIPILMSNVETYMGY